MKTATATCPDCGRSQGYIYSNRLDMIRTAALALETLVHAPDCARYRRHPKGKGDARQLQAGLF